MKKLILFFCFVCVSLSNVYAAEKGKPVFDDRVWKLGWSQNKGDNVYEEYVLEGETVENWSELVTIQFFPGLNREINPDVFEGLLKTKMVAVCPSVQWESLSQSGDDRIWKWHISGCQGQPDQSEIARLKRTEEGMHVWHYAIKKASIPSEQEQLWIEKLKSIEITK